MLGLMQDRPLQISQMIDFAANYFPDVEIFTRTVEGNPTITSRQSKTSVLVKDGATVVMGGLFRQQTADTQEGVPGLSKIPYLGWLFKTTQTRNDNEDLLFFITPRIVRERPQTRNR